MMMSIFFYRFGADYHIENRKSSCFEIEPWLYRNPLVHAWKESFTQSHTADFTIYRNWGEIPKWVISGRKCSL